MSDPSGPDTNVLIGKPVTRVEDERLVTGRGRYITNLPPQDALRAVFVRSPVAHARIIDIDTSVAKNMPGVVAVWTAKELGLGDLPSSSTEESTRRPLLARDVVRFVGEAVAVVFASTWAEAADAAELVAVEYDAMPAVTDLEAALADDAPSVFPDRSNLVTEIVHEKPDALDDAEVVVSGRFVNQRLAPVPLETNSTLAVPDGDGIAVWVSSQAPFRIRPDFCELLGLEPDRVRVVAPDVGGGFGSKIVAYPEQMVVAAAALRLGQGVRWHETRSESMLALMHGRSHHQHIEVGATRDGVITGLRIRVINDTGAYPSPAAIYVIPPASYLMACGPYRIPKVDFRAQIVMTHTTPITAYRGAGRPEVTAMLERAVDMLAAELDIDPVEVRRRNLIPKDAFPYTTPTGAAYDSGDYEGALDEALRMAGYEGLRTEQAERRTRGATTQLGIGVSTYVEVTAPPPVAKEFGAIRIDKDGSVTVQIGVSPQGQGHETAFAQLVAGRLQIPMSSVRVLHSDTATVREGAGTYASRSLQIGGSAVVQATETVVGKARRLAAELLEAAEADLEIHPDGGFAVRGSPGIGLSWAELATIAEDPGRLPDGMEPGLQSEETFDQQAATFPGGAHISVVEVDTDTGMVRLLRHIAVDDAGRLLNPLLANGQIHGGLAQGISQALYEQMVYDDMGNPMTGTLVDYLVPAAPDLPSYETRQLETPSPHNPLGFKGIGEAGTIGSIPAVQNAVVDALSHLGVRHIDMPLSPQRVWRAIRDATSRG
ncbi:MAG TPA: xanthine dehydrogenase family protein molybdopterin-binding subunit [Jiangellaceae bacterium]